MLKQLRHKRFRKTMNDALSLSCYWYAQATENIVPIGNMSDNKKQRPDCVHT